MKKTTTWSVALAVAIAVLGINLKLSAHASSGERVSKPAKQQRAHARTPAPASAPVAQGAEVPGEVHAAASPAIEPAAKDASTPSAATAEAAVQIAQQDGAQTPPAAAATPAASEPFSAEKTAQTCNACHGPDGNSALPETPSLAGQTARYLYIQLKDFKEKRRENPLMSPMAANLDKPQMLALAQYYAEKKLKANGFKADDAKVTAGKRIADDALCTMCHLGGFSGQNEVPRVAGQRYDYIVKQLKEFRAMKRTNDAGNMTSVSKNLKDEEIDALAQYITNLD